MRWRAFFVPTSESQSVRRASRRGGALRERARSMEERSCVVPRVEVRQEVRLEARLEVQRVVAVPLVVQRVVAVPLVARPVAATRVVLEEAAGGMRRAVAAQADASVSFSPWAALQRPSCWCSQRRSSRFRDAGLDGFAEGRAGDAPLRRALPMRTRAPTRRRSSRHRRRRSLRRAKDRRAHATLELKARAPSSRRAKALRVRTKGFVAARGGNIGAVRARRAWRTGIELAVRPNFRGDLRRRTAPSLTARRRAGASPETGPSASRTAAPWWR